MDASHDRVWKMSRIRGIGVGRKVCVCVVGGLGGPESGEASFVSRLKSGGQD